MLSHKLGTNYKDQLDTHMKFYDHGEKVYGNSQVELVRQWYRTALSIPTGQNPLLGDDLDGKLNENFKTSLPSDKSHPVLICGGSWELPALEKGNENRIFIRKAVIDTKTVILVSIINVILPAGGHLAKKHENTKENRDKAKKELKEAMDIEAVSARFKITGPDYSDGVTPVGKFLDKKDLLFISNADDPFTDIEGNENLETDPPDWHTLKMKSGEPSFTSGYYACFELKTPGTYIIDIDGSAPLAGHQDTHFESKDEDEFHIEEKFFHNSSRYLLKVEP